MIHRVLKSNHVNMGTVVCTIHQQSQRKDNKTQTTNHFLIWQNLMRQLVPVTFSPPPRRLRTRIYLHLRRDQVEEESQLPTTKFQNYNVTMFICNSQFVESVQDFTVQTKQITSSAQLVPWSRVRVLGARISTHGFRRTQLSLQQLSELNRLNKL